MPQACIIFFYCLGGSHSFHQPGQQQNESLQTGMPLNIFRSRVNWLLINLCWMALIFACFQPHQGTEGWDIQRNMWEKWFLFIWSSMTNFFVCCLLILFLLPTWLVAEPQERCFCAQLLARWIAGSWRLNSQPPAVHWFRCQCCGYSSEWFWNACSCACWQHWGQPHSHNPLRNFISLCNSCGFF